jgi:predicted metal-dependent phosphoesterase TrpH
MHSYHSDGEWTPKELVDAAVRAGLAAVALTDHDTVSGVAEMQAAGAAAGIEVLAGVEISTWLEADLHLLGYGFDPEDGALAETLARAREGRVERALRMTGRLAELGVPVPWERVLAESAGSAIGRPHVARALVAAGHAASTREAFDRWLGDGKPACIEKVRITPEDAIELLHRAGGVAVAAHPSVAGVSGRLDALVAAGLDGVEVVHTLHGANEVREFAEYADAHGLVKTGGSDFHGPYGGVTVGAASIPDGWMDELRDRIAERRRAALAGARRTKGSHG